MEILLPDGGNDDRWMVEILSSYRMDFALFRQVFQRFQTEISWVVTKANKVFMKGQEKLSSLKQIQLFFYLIEISTQEKVGMPIPII